MEKICNLEADATGIVKKTLHSDFFIFLGFPDFIGSCNYYKIYLCTFSLWSWTSLEVTRKLQVIALGKKWSELPRFQRSFLLQLSFSTHITDLKVAERHIWNRYKSCLMFHIEIHEWIILSYSGKIGCHIQKSTLGMIYSVQ